MTSTSIGCGRLLRSAGVCPPHRVAGHARSRAGADGGAPLDISDDYAPITATPDGTYFTRVAPDTGITLGSGGRLTFTLAISFSHRVLDGFTLADETSHRPLFFGPGVAFEFPCEVTGA